MMHAMNKSIVVVLSSVVGLLLVAVGFLAGYVYAGNGQTAQRQDVYLHAVPFAAGEQIILVAPSGQDMVPAYDDIGIDPSKVITFRDGERCLYMGGPDSVTIGGASLQVDWLRCGDNYVHVNVDNVSAIGAEQDNVQHGS